MTVIRNDSDTVNDVETGLVATLCPISPRRSTENCLGGSHKPWFQRHRYSGVPAGAASMGINTYTEALDLDRSSARSCSTDSTRLCSVSAQTLVNTTSTPMAKVVNIGRERGDSHAWSADLQIPYFACLSSHRNGGTLFTQCKLCTCIACMPWGGMLALG